MKPRVICCTCTDDIDADVKLLRSAKAAATSSPADISAKRPWPSSLARLVKQPTIQFRWDPGSTAACRCYSCVGLFAIASVGTLVWEGRLLSSAFMETNPPLDFAESHVALKLVYFDIRHTRARSYLHCNWLSSIAIWLHGWYVWSLSFVDPAKGRGSTWAAATARS